MTLEDRELENLLKEVVIPASLKDTLREIPNRASDVKIDDQKTWRTVVRWSLALAAALLVAISLPFWMGEKWMGGEKQGQSHQGRMAAKSHLPTKFDPDLLIKSLDESEAKLRQADAMIRQLQLKQTQNRIMAAHVSSKYVSANERQSFALGSACELAVELGASVDDVRSDLNLLIEKYPNTKGAEMAKTLINQHQFHN